MREIQLGTAEVEAVLEVETELAVRYRSVADPEFLDEADTWAQELPRGLRRHLNEFRLRESAGLCLISGARQSVGAARLWTALAHDYRHGFVDVEGRALRYLGEAVADDVHGALHTRRLLLGNGWTLDDLAGATGMTDGAGARCLDGKLPEEGRELAHPHGAANAHRVAHTTHVAMR